MVIKRTQALCDSRPQITCINDHFLKSTDFRNSALIKSIVKSIISAVGTIYKVKGQIKLPIRFKEIIIYQDFQIITELRNPVILGMDFFYTNKVSINIGETMMVINKNGIIKVPLVKKDVGCVRVSNITTIPAFSSEQIPVRITNIIKDKEVIAKPTNIINKHNLLLPRCIISNNKQESYIKIINPSDQPVTLKSCIVIGTCCPVGNKVIT